MVHVIATAAVCLVIAVAAVLAHIHLLALVQAHCCYIPHECGAPGNAQRGSTNDTDTTEGSVVFYNCDQHLVPEEKRRANCTRNGWSPLDPGHLSCSVGTLTED